MPSLPKETLSFRPLHQMLIGQIRFRLLQAGLTLGVFDLLDVYRTADEVAAEMDAHAQSTRFFLDALTNLGLVRKKEGRYLNSPLTAQFLASGSSLYLGPLLAMTKQMSLDTLDDLEERVRKGPCLPQPDDDSPAQCSWVESARASAPWALGEMGCRAAEIISKLPGFEHFEKMLDLGGGHGLFALYFVQASEALHAVVFDHAPVVDLASELIAFYEMGDRVTVMAGDYVRDDIGRDYDLIWASATLSCSKNDLEPLFTKIHGALKPNGYFVSLHDGMTCEQTQPDMVLEWLGGLLSSGRDRRFEQGELAEIMLGCGFSSVRSRTIDTPLGTMDMDVARK
ncbi:MAG: class I SAM-dependent methyltransferase [Desulfarculaceae bacterium]|jgi:SAM-dependent methyltransferase